MGADFQLHGLFGMVCFKGQGENVAPSVAGEVILVSSLGQSYYSSLLIGGMPDVC